MAIVYALTSPTGKKYIGQTKGNLENRYKQHVGKWKLAAKRNAYESLPSKLYNAFSKHNPEEWQCEVLFESDSLKDVLEKECEFIAKFDTIANGYNISKGGDTGNKSGSTSKEHRRKISEAKKQWWASPEGLAMKERNRISGNICIGNKYGGSKK